jgi:hypothetical protein
MFRVQKKKLYNQKEPEEHPGEAGIEEVLQVRQKAYPAQGNES